VETVQSGDNRASTTGFATKVSVLPVLVSNTLPVICQASLVASGFSNGTRRVASTGQFIGVTITQWAAD